MQPRYVRFFETLLGVGTVGYAEWSVTVNDVRTRVGQGWAVVLATTPVHQKLRDSETVNDFLALATIVYERRDVRWLIIHQHVSQPPH